MLPKSIDFMDTGKPGFRVVKEPDAMKDGISRREFVKVVGMGTAGMGRLLMAEDEKKESQMSNKGMCIGKMLRVQPVLVYRLYERKQAKSWREWGGLKTLQDVEAECARIRKELASLQAKAEFALEMLELMQVNSDSAAAAAKASDCDAYLVYAAGAGGPGAGRRDWLELLANTGKPNVMFLRHKSGPVYLWYEIAHPRLLRKGSDEYQQARMDIHDVVVDDTGEVLWRLRCLYGLKNIMGSRIVAVGGPGGWGHPESAPADARKIWKLDIRTVEYGTFGPRLNEFRSDSTRIKEAEECSRKYLADGIKAVQTERNFIVNAFLLAAFLKTLMAEADAQAVTINNCMNIGKITGTTPCLAFSVINDTGSMAFCESDFVVIPSGILLRHISGRPVFLNDPTWPHDGVVTIAHCSAPRRMNGNDLEPANVLTHCESDYGAAPKVLFRKGQTVTNLIPNFDSTKWLGFTGKIIDHPAYDICRSQMDITIDGDWRKLLEDMRGFHWMTCYGDYMKEVGYALGKVGIKWENLTLA